MQEKNEQKTLYIFIDESGNFDFTPTGTKYFVLTSVSTILPLKERGRFLRLRYNLLEKGTNEEYFHATEDKQDVRDLVFEAIKQIDDIEIDAVIAQKNKTNPTLYIDQEFITGQPDESGWGKITLKTVRSEERFYDKISQMLLQYIFRRYEGKDHIEKIVVVLGSLFTKAKRGYVLKSLKRYLNNFKKPFYVYFHTTAADINCQIADYCGWAIYVHVERDETRPLKIIQEKVKSAFEVFERGTTEYYQYKK